MFNISLPKILKIMPVGVTTKKKIKPIIIGDIIDPNKYPNLIHNLFNGVKNFEFKRPIIKKTIEIKRGRIFI